MWNTVLARLQEPSTYAGFAGLAVAFGLSVEEFNIYANALAAIAAVVAMVLQEKGNNP